MASREEKAVKWTLAVAFVMLLSFAVVLVLRDQPSEEVIDQQRQDEALLDLIVRTAPALGNPQADVVLVEFSDFQCPYCKTLEPAIDQVTKDYPNIRRVWIHAINRTEHPESEGAAAAAQCAHEQGKFWEYRSQLFAKQDQLSTALYNQIAQSLSLSLTSFQACLANTETLTTVRAHDQFARRSNVQATPHVTVNNTPLSGDLTYAQIKNTIDQELTKSAVQ